MTTPGLRLWTGIAALALGAFAMGASVLFVRHADVGPFASAFWRVALALPVLALWARIADGAVAFRYARVRADRASILAGAFFAGDLVCWHLAILGTTVANATVLATTSPIWVTAFSVLVLRHLPPARSFIGLLMCMLGAGALVGQSAHFDPGRVAGDAAGLVTAIFFAGYFIAVRQARLVRGAASVMLVSTAVTSIILFVIAVALEPTLWPGSASGLLVLLALALVAQVAGQGLMAVGLAAVPAVFGSFVFFLEVVSAALLGWLLLDEPLSPLQVLGGGLVLFGLVVARPRSGAEGAG